VFALFLSLGVSDNTTLVMCIMLCLAGSCRDEMWWNCTVWQCTLF